MIHYHDWTAAQVRDWLIESAKTATALPRDRGPKKDGNSFHEVVREAWKDAAPMATVSRPTATGGALSRMEAVWTWINASRREEDRRLLYEWAEAKALGKGYLARVMERNELTERTLRRSVMALCQRIADGLNRKHQIRLTMTVDALSEISDPVRDFSVQSKNCANTTKSPTSMMAWAAKPLHDGSPEGIERFEKHLKAVNRSRQNRAKREEERRRQREARRKAA